MAVRQRKGRGLKKAVIGVAASVAVLSAAIAFFQFGSPLEKMLTPDRVGDLKADACYGQVSLEWDEVEHAKKYKIYERSEDGKLESIGTSDSNKYAVEDYDRDSEHEYIVAACGVDPFNKKEYEGEPSEPVKAYYDSSKYAQKIPVLTYHNVVNGSEKPTTGLNVNETDFDEQMKYLHDNGFKTLTMDEFRAWHAGKKEFPVKSCLITFDDGMYGVYYIAYPILKKYDQAATSFLIGHHIEDTTPAFDPDAEESRYIGMDVVDKVREEYPRLEFESHTYNLHKKIKGKRPVTVMSYDEMVDDCERNKQFGFDYVAYPWGTYNETIQEALKDTGYKMAFAYRPFKYATRDDDTYAINRIKVNGMKDMDNFVAIVNGEKE